MAAAYSASKAAVIALTKAVGKDFARTGVSVNCIAPAVIETAMLGDMSQEHVDYMVEQIPMGRMGNGRRGRGADLLARERGVLVLDRGDLRHLRRPGDVLMRHVRFRDARRAWYAMRRRGARTSELPAGITLLRPVDPPEVWCAGVTYERSRDARIEESGSDVYALVYDADRPELFLKDAAVPPHRRAGRPDRDPLRCDVERPRARDRRRARRRPRDRRLHDRQRRLVTRHRGSEPALPARRRRCSPRRAPSGRRSTCRRTGTRRSRSS